MFGKDKVKGHNRLVKSKSGFKVTRVGDFLRKKDDKDNTARNVVLGVGAISALGIGTVLLLKKKGGIKFPGQLAGKKPLLTERKSPVKVIEETVGTPPKQPVKSGKDSIAQMDEEWGVGNKKVSNDNVSSVVTPTGKKNDMPELRDFWNTKNTPRTRMLENGDRLLKVSKRASGVRKKTGFSQVSDPWSTPIKSSVKESTEKVVQETQNIKALAPAKFKPESIYDPWETAITIKADNSLAMVVTPKSRNTPLLTGKKIPASRGDLLVYDNRISRKVAKKASSDAIRIDTMEKTYKSISPDNLAMRATVKIDHYLKRPRKTSNLGAAPKPTSLEEVLNNPNIKQAQKKVEDRLSRAERRQLQRKASNVKKTR